MEGRYLFDDRGNADTFAVDPHADRAVGDLERRGLAVERVERHEIADDPLVAPVFVVSAPRSGSTVLFEALGRADDLWTPGDDGEGVLEGIPRLYPASRGYDSHRLTEADADASTIRTVRAGFLSALRDRRGRRYLDLPPRERPSRIRLLEQRPENALRIPFLAEVFPDALFVHLLRDARESVSSIVEGWGNAGFVNLPELPEWDGSWHFLLPPGWRDYRGRSAADVATFQWAAANRTILEDLAALPQERWITVDYAALVASPATELQRLCAFADISFGASLADLGRRGLPVSATTLTPPAPGKWRYNRSFDVVALEPAQPLIDRLSSLARERAPAAEPSDRGRVAFSCFLDDLDEPDSPAHPQAAKPDGLVVDPTFEFQLGVTIPLALVRRSRFRERFVAGFPIAWTEDAATAVLQPVWVRHRQIWLFRSLRPGAPPPPELPTRMASLMTKAGILGLPEEWAKRRRFGEEQAQEAAESFARSGYCTLRSLLHPAHVRALSRYYEELIASGTWSLGDAQVPGRYGWYNESLARFYHHQLAGYVSRAVGDLVKPSYAYVSAYQGGAILDRHVDREQCEFTMSYLIDQEPDDGSLTWPLYLETPKGTVELVQSVGDAVVFRGTTVPHYRPLLPDGLASTSLLFHYVPSAFARTRY